MGPRMQPAPYTNASNAKYKALSAGVVKEAIKLIVPKYIPAPPPPAHTRPTMRAFMLGAAPHSALPAAKLRRLAMKSHFWSNMPYACPIGRMVTVEPSEKPTPSQPSSETLFKAPETAPWISAVIVVSSPAKCYHIVFSCPEDR